MSTTTSTGNGGTSTTTGAPRKRRPRSASEPREAFFILQVLDESGKAMPFDKKRIKLVAVERDGGKAFDYVDSDTHPNTVVLRGIVPPGRGGPAKTA